MEFNSIQKKGFIMLAIGIIMIIFILVSKIKTNLFKNSNTTNTANNTSQVQLENVEMDKNADYIITINTYMQGLIEKDVEKIESVFPDIDLGDIDVNEQINSVYTTWETECGANIKISYTIEKVQKADSTTIESIETEIKNQYSTFTGNLEDVYYATLNLNITGDTEIKEEEYAMILAKIDGKWCVF